MPFLVISKTIIIGVLTIQRVYTTLPGYAPTYMTEFIHFQLEASQSMKNTLEEIVLTHAYAAHYIDYSI